MSISEFDFVALCINLDHFDGLFMIGRLFFRNPKPPIILASEERRYQIARSGKDLVEETEWRRAQVRQIKRLYSVTSGVWEEHYLSAIERFADFAQALPASEIHHHSRPGGLLDHTLETLLAGSRVALGYMLPPNAEPEALAANGDRWRFGAFVALLAHDLGKVVTDIEVVYRRTVADEFLPWHSWSGLLPLGCEYAYRFRPRAANAGVAKSLHEKAAISLLPHLLTNRAIMWIWSDPELLAQFLSTVNHAPFGGGALSEIVRFADRASASQDLGADTGVETSHSSATPLHEKLIIALRQLVVDGELGTNRPGAAVWVTDKNSWAVSKKVGEALRDHLILEGHKGVPKSVLRIFSVLLDHNMVVPNPNGDPVWQARIEDHEKNWSQKLSFLRFNNSLLWPTGDPRKFSGEVVPLDSNGNLVVDLDANPLDEQEGAEVASDVESTVEAEVKSEPTHEPAAEPMSEPVEETTPEPSVGTTPEPVVKTTPESVASTSKEPKSITISVDIEGRVRERKPPNSPVNPMFVLQRAATDAAGANDFLRWLVKEAGTRTVRVNEPDALIHVLDDYVAIVSPRAFYVYLKCNSIRRKAYEMKSQGAKPFSLVQRELTELDIHKSMKGQNIAQLKITGAKNQTELSCILIYKRHLPFFKKFSPNKAVTIA